MLAIILPYTIVVSLLVAIIVFVVLVNKNVVLRYSNGTFKRILTKPLILYSLRRIASAAISFVLAVAVTFCLLRIQDKSIFCAEPGWNHFGPDIREMLCEQKLNSLGLNDPMMVQLLKFFYQILPFPKEICKSYRVITDNGVGQYICVNSFWTLFYLGRSSKDSTQIVDTFARTMPISLVIGLGGLIIETVIGYPMGVFMAKYKNKWFDKLGNAYIILVGSIPGLVYFYLLQALLVKGFGVPLRWTASNFASNLGPIITLGIGGVAGIALWVRRYMVDEFGSDYVKFARSKGVSENVILFKHVLRNAVVPLIRSIPAGVIYCLLGSYFVEMIYGVDGFGKLLVLGVQTNDYPVVQACVVVSAIITIIANLVGDITTAIADPRISFTSKS